MPIAKDNFSGSRISNFKKAVSISMLLVKDAGPRFFSSPYSLAAPLSQMLGLNTPSMGSGDSPYSIASTIFNLQDRASLFREIFEMPIAEKRKIVDEFYEMIAPSLLGEEDEYIELLIGVKYRRALRKSATEAAGLRNVLKEKFSILSPLVKQLNNKKGDYGYIVHYGYPEDLYREHSFLEAMPKALARKWREHSFPIVNEIGFKNFPTFGSRTKKSIKGWVIFIANDTKELLENNRLRKKKILQAARLAKTLGAKVIGMGGLIASFAQGGRWLSEQLKGVGFSTGHAYTIGNILEIMDDCVERVGLDIQKATVAVVGAAGSIGSGCVRLLAERSPKSIFLIDLNTFNARQKLEALDFAVKEKSPRIKTVFSNSLADMKKADIVIVATNSPTSLIASKYLKRGALVIDDSFPKNASRELVKERDDIILLDGGIMRLPFSLDIYFARNMPDLMDAPLTRVISCKETYGCFAEILVLALYGYKGSYGLGHSDPLLAKDILAKSRQIGFSLAPPQCFDEAVEEKRFKKASRVIIKRQR